LVFVWNVGTCRSNAKGEIQVETPQDESTDAEHRGGLPRSSDEASVMEVERRGDGLDSVRLDRTNIPYP